MQKIKIKILPKPEKQLPEPFHIFLNTDISITFCTILTNLNQYKDNIHMEGAVSPYVIIDFVL